MKKIEDLQALINERAEEKLKKDIRDFSDSIKSAFGGKGQTDLFPKVEYKALKQTPYWFFEPQREYMTEVFNNLLPGYIERETKDFFAQVENLRNDVDNLLNSEF